MLQQLLPFTVSQSMSKDQSYGFAIFIISIVVAVVYLAAFFAHYIGLPAEWEKWNRDGHGDDKSQWRPPLKILIV